MKLRRIKLAGFKSFADPVTIEVSSRIAGIVGPNGAGKSNLIDAVRWVSGESSARNLRGITLDDVIFNGSANRNPAGRASVELVFDNTGGRAPGMWSKYAEISVRRTLSRDGLSEYNINGTRVNRRDVTQMFLGTGFGARSYSIIEQGMISRIIEAKPDELSGHIEEASGISRFREQRKETMSKLRSTSENLERLDIMRGEVQSRLNQLKMQSSQAQRFRGLKERQRKLQVQLLAHEFVTHQRLIAEKTREQSEHEVSREQRLADLRKAESELEGARKAQLDLQSSLSEMEMERYRTDAQAAAIERKIEDSERVRSEDAQTVFQARSELADLQRALKEQERRKGKALLEKQACDEKVVAQKNGHGRLHADLVLKESDASQAAQVLAETERSMIEVKWQLDSADKTTAQAEQTWKVKEQELASLNDSIDEHQPVVESSEECQLKSRVEQISDAIDAMQSELEQAESRMEKIRLDREQCLDQLDELRQSAQETRVRLISLQRSQQMAESERKDRASAWLQARGLDDASELSKSVAVAEGWERAVDRVLGNRLSAIQVDDIGSVEMDHAQTVPADLFLVEPQQTNALPNGKLTPLARFVEVPDGLLDCWLSGVYAAESFDEAMNQRSLLASGNCIVSADGAMVGANWLSPRLDEEGQPAGVLELSKRIRQVKALVEKHEAQQSQKREEIEKLRTAGDELSTVCNDLRSRLTELSDERVELQLQLNEIGVKKSVHEQRYRQMRDQIAQTTDEIEQARRLFERSGDEMRICNERLIAIRKKFAQAQAACDNTEAEVQGIRNRLVQAVERRHASELEAVRCQSELNAAEVATAELLEKTKQRNSDLIQAEARLGQEDPIPGLKIELDKKLESSLCLTDKLAGVRRKFEGAESEYRKIDQARLQCQLKVEEASSILNETRVEIGTLAVQSEGVVASMSKLDADAKNSVDLIEDDFDPERAAIKCEKMGRRLENFGPINLTAIDECEQEQVRKDYMDRQFADLAEAVATLEATIKKIDRETCQRFVRTFEAVNRNFQEIFPKLFVGGRGHLELSGEYPNDAGVCVFARPKGKRINLVQSLSGGEKALAAIALLLAIYQLNPAPVCFLDEVDAPLDDENVFRLCQNLRQLSERTQLLMVTHNKITMENADMLIGVAMSEPNVSQILSVNLEQAQEYAA